MACSIKSLAVHGQISLCSPTTFYASDAHVTHFITPKTYYSYTTIIKDRNGAEFDEVLEGKVGMSGLRYVVEKNKSEIARISMIGKRYFHLISLTLEKSNATIKLEEIEKME